MGGSGLDWADDFQKFCGSGPEVFGVTFSDTNCAPVPKFLKLVPGPAIFKFENPSPVQTPAAIIDPTVICPCFCLRKDHTESCYC